MKLLLASVLLLTTSACAQRLKPVPLAPPGTTAAAVVLDAKDAQIELLQAQLAEAQVNATIVDQAGRLPDAVAARFAVIQAQQRLAAARKK